MAEDQLKPLALRMLAWGCLWSPLAEDDEHREAWDVLELPGNFEDVRLDYWNSFQAGMPQPPVSLLLHALLQREGAGVREDWMRAADYLELEWGERRLPPDHLGPACEVFGLAVEREEPVLIDALLTRYLRPWLQAAHAALSENSALSVMLLRFSDDIEQAAA